MENSTSSNHKLTPVLIFVLLSILLIQAVLSMRVKSPTFDEPFHLIAGYIHLIKKDLDYKNNHPPLIRQLAALPLLFLDLKLPKDTDQWGEDIRQGYGKRFLYSPGNDADKIVFLGRLPIVFLSILLGLYVYIWTRDLYGQNAGLFSLFLYVFSPNIIAHSRLITTDLGSTCFIFIACYYFWKFLKEPSLSFMCLAGLTIGLALVSKFSALLLFPIFFILLVANFTSLKISVFKENLNDTKIEPKKFWLQRFAAISLIVIGMIFLIFQMQHDAFSKYIAGIERLMSIHFNHNRDYLNYLMGEFSQNTFWYYYIVAFLIKTPVPTLILFVLAFSLYRQSSTNRINEFFILLPVIIFITASSFDGSNVGLRRILPIYPFLFVYIGILLQETKDIQFTFLTKKKLIMVLSTLMAWYGISSMKTFPDYLTYFNDIVGGPKKGILYLDDSNIDWGQDLKRLKEFLDKREVNQIKLLYHGQADPDYYGIKYSKFTSEDDRFGPRDGYYAISAHKLIRLITNPDWGQLGNPIGIVGNSIFVFKFSSP